MERPLPSKQLKKGQFYCAKYELQQFLKQGGGVMVNLASDDSSYCNATQLVVDGGATSQFSIIMMKRVQVRRRERCDN